MSDLRSGSTIAGRYRLDAIIGEGGMAVVWRGMDLSLSREVAIKVLREEIGVSADAVARFRKEAHSAAQLNHPNIVQIYDTGVDGDVHYIVMECLDEPDLKRIITEWAPLPEEKVIDVAIQCCRALSYAHKQGVVHRDVKPHNVLFTDDGRLKLSDFGIAAAAGSSGLGPGGTVLGSAPYMAPEQVQGSPAGPHSDLYSVGCVMYEALTGSTPFTGRSEDEIAAKHLRERPASVRAVNSSVSPSTEFVVSKAMAREVAKRYRSADEMLADLNKLQGGQGLDRTGVLQAPQGATSVLQPAAAPREIVSPGLSGRGDEIQVTPRPLAPIIEQRVEPRTVAPRAPAPDTRRPAWGALLVLSMAVVALILVAVVAKRALSPGDADTTVQVPLVKGYKRADAQRTLEAHGLKLGSVTEITDSSSEPGVVIEQTPAEGQAVKAETAVDIVVNRGREQVAVPPVEEMTFSEANEELERAGLAVGNDVKQVYHATVPAGRVIKQETRPGVRVNKGDGINLVISKGPDPGAAPPPVEVPPEEPVPTEVDPSVELTEDTEFAQTHAGTGKRRFYVTVTVQGQERAQMIKVVTQDDRGGRTTVLETRLDPAVSKRIPVLTEGAATIEVYHNGSLVWHLPMEAPDRPSDDAVSPEDEVPEGKLDEPEPQ